MTLPKKKTERRVISLEKFFHLHKEAKSWTEVEALLQRLMKPTRDKWDVAYTESGRLTSTNGRKYGVFIVGENHGDFNKLVYRFRVIDISGLDSDLLGIFAETLGPYQLVRSTLAF